MHLFGAPLPRASGCWRNLAFVAAGLLLAASLVACGDGGSDAASVERLLELEAKVHSLEESLETLGEENATLQRELIDLRQRQAAYFQEQEAAKIAGRIERQAAAEFEEVQEEQILTLIGEQARTEWRLDDLDSRAQELEEVASQVELVLPALEKWFTGTDKRLAKVEGTVIQRTARLAEESGGEVYYIDSREPEERAILLMPLEPIQGNPLIVSLHGYGGNSADHSIYVPLHERVNSHGFGLLLPNGTVDAQGNSYWNPTGEKSSSGKASADDVAYLTDLVARAKAVKDFGPVYFFGHSNGGFMAYHMACKGLPGLRAVASLAGTSYVEDSECEGAPPVSVLHIHGSADDVVLFEGEIAEPRLESEAVSSYAGAQEMLMRWGERAGCEWPKDSEDFAHQATLDLDQYIAGPETLVFRPGLNCPEGISTELWIGLESGHSPGYGDAFADALLDWLLAQK